MFSTGTLGEYDEGSPPGRICPKATLIRLTKAANVGEGPCPAKVHIKLGLCSLVVVWSRPPKGELWWPQQGEQTVG